MKTLERDKSMKKALLQIEIWVDDVPFKKGTVANNHEW